MHALESGDDLHNTLGASILELESRALPATEQADPVNLSLRPSLWSLGGGALPSPNPLYGATPHLVASPLESEEVRQAIREVVNCVIEVQSEGLLPDFLPQSHPSASALGLEVLVTFLGAPWELSLNTRGSAAFHLDGGGVVDHEMIGAADQQFAYLEHDDFEAVQLRIRGGQLMMMMVVPKPGAFADLSAFTSTLTPATLAEARDGAGPTTVNLSFPKFTVDSVTLDYKLPLGLNACAFFPSAVLHGATVEVDEKGIKAAAASVNEGDPSGGIDPLIDLFIDRPFLFFVFDRETNFVLFSGRYAGTP
jgi:serine protease inhibitor